MLAPVVRGRKGEYGELLRELQTKGYSRARVDGTIVRLDEALAGQLPALKKYEKHDIEVIVDRLAVKDTARRRLTDSVETALGLSGGVVVLDFVDLPENDPHRERMYSEHLACLYDDLSFDELEPRSFSFNSPWGACPDCTGLGTKLEVDPELIVPDESQVAGRRRDRAVEQRPSQRLLRPADRGPRRDASGSGWTRRGPSCPPRPARPCCAATTCRSTSATRTGTAGSARTTRPSRA